jgi:glutathione S-transferase
MPTDPRGRAKAVEWVFAALNSVEMASLPWSMFRFMGFPGNAPEAGFDLPPEFWTGESGKILG